MPQFIKPLIATPKPFPTESLMGFILRTSELNGCSNPNNLLRYAGLTDNEIRAVRMPIRKIARLYDCKESHFSCFNYSIEGERDNSKEFTFNGHEIHSLYLNAKSARVCPDCIRENGFADIVWYLRHAIICPKHAQLLMSKCPACNKKIGWARRGLLVCRCGGNLTKEPFLKVQDLGALAISECIRSKFHRKSEFEIASSLNFPVKEIQELTLQAFLGLTASFGQSLINRVSKDQEFDVIITAAKVWSNWPKGFYNLLDSIEPKKHFSLRKQYENLYVKYVKRQKHRNETNFIKQAFMNYGTYHQQLSLTDSRWVSPTNKLERSVGITELSRETNVHPKTLHKLVIAGVISATEISNGKNTRLVFKLTEELLWRLRDRKRHSAKVASNMVGIPKSVLKNLKETCYFRDTSLSATILPTFKETDIQRFLCNFLTEIRMLKRSDYAQPCLYLSHIMNMKSLSVATKSAIIIEIIRGKIWVLGRTGNKFSNIILPNNFSQEIVFYKATIIGYYSITAAATFLSCDRAVIIGLIKNNYISAIDNEGKLQIPQASLIEFSKSYVPCSTLTKYHGDSIQYVKKHYVKMGAKIIEMNYGKRNVISSIIQLKGYPVLTLSYCYLSDLESRLNHYKSITEVLNKIKAQLNL